jgi:hypothetical protein
LICWRCSSARRQRHVVGELALVDDVRAAAFAALLRPLQVRELQVAQRALGRGHLRRRERAGLEAHGGAGVGRRRAGRCCRHATGCALRGRGLQRRTGGARRDELHRVWPHLALRALGLTFARPR